MRPFLLLVACSFLGGCTTGDLFHISNTEVSIDKSEAILELPYRTFGVKPIENFILELQQYEDYEPYGYAIESEYQGRWYEEAVIAEIQNKFESIGLTYDENAYDLMIYFGFEFYSKPIDRSFYETRLSVYIFGLDTDQNIKLFELLSSFKSQAEVSPLNLGEPAQKTLNQLRIFQPVAGGDTAR